MSVPEEPVRGPLTGKVALVTGAARGQGRAHAELFAARGAAVVITDVATQVEGVPYLTATKDDLEDTAQSIRAAGGRAGRHHRRPSPCHRPHVCFTGPYRHGSRDREQRRRVSG